MLSPKAAQIRDMFSAIAHRYDFLNHVLSLNIDKLWRKKAVDLLRGSLRVPFPLCLDLCCGTGDLSLEMSCIAEATIVGCDFSHPMLHLQKEKLRKRMALGTILTVEADALNLPFRSGTFDGVAIAFGLRNLDDPCLGLAEMYRVLKPGGALVVLEFSKLSNPMLNHLFRYYFFRILPRIGRFVSRHDTAYTYLPDSVRQFPDQEELMREFRKCGFQKAGYRNLTSGVAALHFGTKATVP